MEITQEILTELTKDKLRHETYGETVKHADRMAVHAYGKKPEELITDYRPREEEVVRKYRLAAYEPFTQSKFDKAISILQKIFNPKLYSVTWPENPSAKAPINEENSLEKYITEDYPNFDSLFNYVREVLLKSMIADPNGVICIRPKEMVEENQFVRPVPIIYASKYVLNYDEENFIIKDPKVIKKKGRDAYKIHVYDKVSIVTYEQDFRDNGEIIWDTVFKYTHEFGMIPVWFLGGLVEATEEGYMFKSFFNPVLAFWNKAIRSESDLDAAYVNHMHPKMWELEIDCEYEQAGSTCQGGMINIKGKQRTCPQCNGRGKVKTTGPFDVYRVQADKLGDNKNNIIPPMGYVQLDTKVVELTEQRVEKLVASGLAAINMDIVNMIGANQSGIAKEYDRSELHSFMQQIADYVFDNHIPNIIYFTALYRYGVVLEKNLVKYLPNITKPTNFDILTLKELTSEVSEAKNAKVSPIYTTALESDVVAKRFSTNSDVKNRVIACIKLDPLPNLTATEKSDMLLTGAASKVDVIISNYVTHFVDQAVAEDPTFYEKDFLEQYAVLEGYAKAKEKESKPEVNPMIEDDPGAASGSNRGNN